MPRFAYAEVEDGQVVHVNEALYPDQMPEGVEADLRAAVKKAGRELVVIKGDLPAVGSTWNGKKFVAPAEGTG